MKLDTWELISDIIEAGGLFIVIEEDSAWVAYDRLGKIHRAGGPAIIYLDGTQQWWRHGRLHRDDGPAIIHPDGSREWWQDGEPCPKPDT